MKKILLATTVLGMSAGFAAADVAVSGDARMGIASYNGDAAFSNRVRISFAGSGTTDGGLAFGGSVRADNSGAGAAGTDGSVFISGAFGKITMGGVDSGDAAAVGQLSSVGYEGLGSGNSIGYSADGGLIGFGDNDIELTGTAARVLYTYSSGALTATASVSQIDNTEFVAPDTTGAVVGTTYTSSDYGVGSYGLGVSYNAGAVTVAAGYGVASGFNTTTTAANGADTYVETESSITDMSASVKFVSGDTTVKGIYQDKSAEQTTAGVSTEVWNAVSMGASVDHKIDAVTVTAYTLTTTYSADVLANDISLNRMGLGAAYDLGGGAAFKAGWSNIEVAVTDGSSTTSVSQDNFDAGLTFSF